jgi:hypothetical protein
VKDRNYIRYDHETTRDPLKDRVLDSDLPELQLTSAGSLQVNLSFNSCGTMIMRRFAWVISTGDYRLQDRLYPLEFAILCGMLKAQRTLGSIQWNGSSFIKNVRIIDGSNGILDPTLNRGINGWTALWNVELEMHFKQSDLIAHLEI